MAHKTLDDLPKWAQALINDEMVIGALRWPLKPEPEPAFVCNGTSQPSIYSGETVYSAHVSYGSVSINKWDVSGGLLYPARLSVRTSGVGSRGNGPYYATEADALLAAEWRYCRETAKTLLAIRGPRK